MSDREGGEDDVGLPKATVYKLIAEKLKDEFGCSKEAKEVIVEACVVLMPEWVKLLSTEANEACDNSAKKTISPEHVTAALQKLSYERFIPLVEESNTDFKKSQKVRAVADCEMARQRRNRADQKERARAVPDTKGMTQEQLLELQERLFSDSRNRLGDGPAE